LAAPLAEQLVLVSTRLLLLLVGRHGVGSRGTAAVALVTVHLLAASAEQLVDPAGRPVHSWGTLDIRLDQVFLQIARGLVSLFDLGCGLSEGGAGTLDGPSFLVVELVFNCGVVLPLVVFIVERRLWQRYVCHV